jgi:drug/metabolite transporter (DMT)-like permease
MWGASFLLIKLGVHDFAPESVAWLRLLFGAVTLGLLPGARAPLRHRQDGWRVVFLGLIWMAVPFVLFPLAEQTIDSALAGMLNSAAPLFTAVIAALWFRYRPMAFTGTGLLIGFAGVLAVTIPSIDGSSGLLGVLLVLAATVLYGLAFNLAEPLESRNGALPVIWRAMLAALVLTTPTGLNGLFHSTPGWDGTAALLLLGVVSTGAAFACFVTLVGRVGAARASVAIYLVPVVAIVLGAFAASESIHPISLGGIGLILLGAWLTSLRPRTARVSR